jgi:enolase-phosphatase E1
MIIKYILTDIEGTTTSVAFVYEVLFPYFKAHVAAFLEQPDNRLLVQSHIDTVIEEAGLASGAEPEAIGAVLVDWTNADKKHTALKSIQGVVWKQAYEQGLIKGHVYPDVVPVLRRWQEEGVGLGVYSSGSVAAQKLLFGFSEEGDLTALFSHYFDTTIGSKRESAAYSAIAKALQLSPNHILFLSDVIAELDAARQAGFCTLQVLRPGTEPSTWHPSAAHFGEIAMWLES